MRYLFSTLQALELYNASEVVEAGQVQITATRRWGHRLLEELVEYDGLGKKYRQRLVTRIINAVNEEHVEVQAERLSEHSIMHILAAVRRARSEIARSRLYLHEISEYGHSGVSVESCFTPDVEDVMNQKRVFSLVPSYSLNRQYVSVDLTTLRQLAFTSGLRINLAHEEGNQGDKHEQATRLFAQVFDFQKVRYPSPNSNKCFTNLIRTDGYGVDFIFARQESDSAALPELEVNDFSPWELRNTFELWDADPGVTQTYVVANGHGDAPHHIKQMSSVEFSTLAGYYLTNARTRTLKV
jgi:hypothetical protein